MIGMTFLLLGCFIAWMMLFLPPINYEKIRGISYFHVSFLFFLLKICRPLYVPASSPQKYRVFLEVCQARQVLECRKITIIINAHGSFHKMQMQTATHIHTIIP